MTWHIWLYLAVLLGYLAYPLYLLMGPPHEGARRTLGLQLLAYGLAGLFWPGALPDYLVIIAGASASAGLALLFRRPPSRLPWLIVMAYALGVLGSHTIMNPLWTLLAALIFVAAFERALLREEPGVSHG